MYLFLILSVIFASLNSLVLHRARLSGGAAVFSYNFLSAIVWSVCLFAANGFTLHLDGAVILWGVIYGITQAAFILFKTLSMNTGPVSITTLIGNFSLVVSVLVCYILWQERVGIFDLLGLLLLLLGIVLATYKRGGEAFGRKWKIFVVIFLLLSAAIGIVFKAFSKTDSSDAAGDMMLVSSFVMIVCYGVMYLAVKGRRTAEEKSRAGKHHIGSSGLRSFVACALLSGLLSCLYNRFNIYLSGALDAVIFFPSFNGGVIFTSALLGVLCLGERLSRSQLTGILCGILGIILIGIF